jgi:hypothetical protein
MSLTNLSPAINETPEFSIADLFFQAYRSERLTLTHRQHLKTAILESNLSQEDQTAVDRLLHAVRRGWLQVVD